jgi:uncharacterized membrane protein YiaA
MLASITRKIPAISVIAVAAISLFNVGYFWHIGLQFLGIIDFGNLVYSFGLSFTFLMVSFIFLSVLVLYLFGSKTETPEKLEANQRALKRTKRLLFVAVIITAILDLMPNNTNLVIEVGIASGVAVAFICFGTMALLDQSQPRKGKLVDLTGLALTGCILVFQGVSWPRFLWTPHCSMEPRRKEAHE